MRGAIAGILGFCLLATPALADAPPTAPVDSLHAPAVSKVFAQSFGLGAMKTPFGATGLADLQKVLGAGSVQRMGGSISWLCYDMPKTKQRVWLSSGEGSGGLLDTVTTRPLAAGAAPCPALPDSYQPLVIDSGLKLGMTRAELTKVLGAPSRQVDTWVVYSGASSGAASNFGLAVQFVGDHAVFLSASRLNPN